MNNIVRRIIINRLTVVFCDSCEFEDILDAAKTLQDHPLCLETMVGDLQAAKNQRIQMGMKMKIHMHIISLLF